nr:hypothetical protein [Clostridia bacterium]
MQWYEPTSKRLEAGQRYSHRELIGLLRSDYPHMRDSSYHWAICGMLKSGEIIKTARNVYMVPDGKEKQIYRPIYSDLASKLILQIAEKYPTIQFTVFETGLMNDFLNHLVAQNTIFIQAEKEISVFVFRFLQENGYERLLYKPKKADYALYWEKDCIVVTDLVSEAPLSVAAQHEICLEKMLVDMYCDKLISTTYSKSEYPQVLYQAMESYHMEIPKMMRYARRRGRESEIKHILEERGYAEA